MKTTIDLPDKLLLKAKSEAKLRGFKFDQLVQEGLRLVLQTTRGAPPRRSLEELMAPARGVVDSGVPDLGSNAKHLESFGRAARRNP